MASIRNILPPQPYYLPGYTGFVPGLKFQCGESYAKMTNTLFLDQRITRSEKPVLLKLGEVHEGWLSKDEEEALRNRCHDNKDCRYTEDMISSYSGHVPQYKFCGGQKFPVNAAMGICKFMEKKNSCLCLQCKSMNAEENEKEFIKTNVDGVAKTYTRPSKEIPGGLKKINEMYAYKNPIRPTAPYFMEMDNPEKYYKQGYAGHIPSLNEFHGISNTPITNEALKMFTTRYEKQKANAKLPAVPGLSDPKPKMVSRILPYEEGIIKNYAGHIPGSMFNVGQTLSVGSKSTRNVLGMNKQKQ